MKEIQTVETLENLSPEFNANRLGDIAIRNLEALEDVDLGINLDGLL